MVASQLLNASRPRQAKCQLYGIAGTRLQRLAFFPPEGELEAAPAECV